MSIWSRGDKRETARMNGGSSLYTPNKLPLLMLYPKRVLSGAVDPVGSKRAYSRQVDAGQNGEVRISPVHM